MDIREAVIQAAATRPGVTLKVKQLEAIMAFISGSDVFVTLPNRLWQVFDLWASTVDLMKSMYGRCFIIL